MRALSAVQLVHVEARRRAAEGREIERLDQRLRSRDRLDRQAGADPRQLGVECDRLDPGLAHRLDAERAEPLRRACPPSRPAAPHARRRAARRPARSNICICSAVLVTWSSPRTTWVTPMSISSIDARQHVEPAAVLAADHRIVSSRRDRNAGDRGSRSFHSIGRHGRAGTASAVAALRPRAGLDPPPLSASAARS